MTTTAFDSSGGGASFEFEGGGVQFGEITLFERVKMTVRLDTNNRVIKLDDKYRQINFDNKHRILR